jgi:hypothetical protein
VPKHHGANIHDKFDLGWREARHEPKESFDCAVFGVVRAVKAKHLVQLEI